MVCSVFFALTRTGSLSYHACLLTGLGDLGRKHRVAAQSTLLLASRDTSVFMVAEPSGSREVVSLGTVETDWQEFIFSFRNKVFSLTL